ncbi:alpha/beta-hydrolase [Coprinopsis marcescibilis]|uniref:Alpha/beta-hydrolase n=1 Tax=Coprinopsis marcescibilis TaxID=230819 RepID=A0A5C3KVI4_COPMA|nr:alpha/beta-hydrolase [Coprinopsis marcescibilis]
MFPKVFSSSSLRAIATTLLLASSWRICATAFDLAQFSKSSASCKAVNRAANNIIVDLELRYVDVNPHEESTIIMVHGWPGIWSTWARQIEEFGKDHRLIVPNLRGFGDSGHPGDVRSSGTMGDFVGDLVCILEAAGVSHAICMGHDWGAAICYEAVRSRPDIFVGAVGAAIPYVPAHGPFLPISALTSQLPKLTYQLFFDRRLDEAASELDADIRRTLRGTFRTVASPPPSEFLTSSTTFLGAWNGIDIPPVPFFTAQEEDYYIQEMSISGYRNTLQLYTTENRQLSWELAHNHGNHTVDRPVLGVYPSKDPVADWGLLQELIKTKDFISDYEYEFIHAAHWLHLEEPKRFNKMVRTWIQKKYPRSTRDAVHGDEL